MPVPSLTQALAIVAAIPLALFDGCSREEANVALGTTSRDRVALTATASEVIRDLPVAEGSPVEEGTILVRLDDSIQAANVALAQANLAQAQANLTKLQAGARAEEIAKAAADVAGARAEFVEAEANYERNRALIESDTITEAALDAYLAKRDSAQATLKGAEESLRELENGTRPEDLAIAEAEVASAEASLAAEQRKLEDLVIRATRNGILDSLPWNLGERVTAGSPVAVLLAGDEMLVRVYIPEPYRAQLADGDPMTVHVDGVDTPFEGRITWISSDPAFTPYYALNQSERSRLMYMADIALPPEASDLPVGVPAQAELP